MLYLTLGRKHWLGAQLETIWLGCFFFFFAWKRLIYILSCLGLDLKSDSKVHHQSACVTLRLTCQASAGSIGPTVIQTQQMHVLTKLHFDSVKSPQLSSLCVAETCDLYGGRNPGARMYHRAPGWITWHSQTGGRSQQETSRCISQALERADECT